MAERKRKIPLIVYVTEDERETIQRKMELAGSANNFSRYARKMLIDGYVIQVDHTPLKELAREIGGIGRNINQIAARANTTGNLYAEDIQEIKERMNEVWHIVRYTLLSQR
ncbi:mobilization protein [Christensenella minuta]|uniref:Bacterial mobilization protein MobC n=1 Tax=Christensenella minuta TaxID=626937 RepID=A0A136Q769_9FIRM|nr:MULTISPECIES: plasmid mobilization relaxosome protein MobC [Christensenella]BDF59296.1 mobilization protein [Christensenellaceae bacterium]AYH40241.1 plasmid mobilization relaxosome protein MobC [Christensenella minuta]KXK66444.1 bacterial mobilization protein MobC [Christensenella minuta]OAQ38043.1 mobilization protein [Christensenella minuta]BDF61962.1 mobilization protein [Christensenellaceae bacterium]